MEQTPHIRILLERLTVFHLFSIFHALSETISLITAFTLFRYLIRSTSLYLRPVSFLSSIFSSFPTITASLQFSDINSLGSEQLSHAFYVSHSSDLL